MSASSVAAEPVDPSLTCALCAVALLASAAAPHGTMVTAGSGASAGGRVGKAFVGAGAGVFLVFLVIRFLKAAIAFLQHIFFLYNM